MISVSLNSSASRRFWYRSVTNWGRRYLTSFDSKGKTVECESIFHSSTSKDKSLKVVPIDEHSSVLTHIHFSKRMNYERGLEIQESFVRLNLDFKKIESKIFKNLKSFNHQQDVTGNQNFQKDKSIVSDYELDLVAKILADKPKPLLLTFEFNPIYTGGKREKKNSINSSIYNYNGAHYLQVERGGQITFHGPGQLVAYPILDLKSFTNLSPKCFVSILQNSIISLLRKDFDITSKTNDHPGVWIDDLHKVASIGVQIRRAITSHGISLNINTDTSYFNSKEFVICGLPSECQTVTVREILEQKGATSQKDLSIEGIANLFAKELSSLLGISDTRFYRLD